MIKFTVFLFQKLFSEPDLSYYPLQKNLAVKNKFMKGKKLRPATTSVVLFKIRAAKGSDDWLLGEQVRLLNC